MTNTRTTVASRCFAALLGSATLLAGAQSSAQELNLYTTREPVLVQTLLTVFTKLEGIKVNTVFVKDGLLERVKAEGERTSADVLMVADIGQLVDLSAGGVTQAIQSKVLDAAIPAHLRAADHTWFALSQRARVLYADKSLKLGPMTYEDLTKPEWKGKVCIRSGQHPYNTGLVASMIAHNGAEATEAWLRGLKGNLARKAAGGDRDVARDILGGICDIGVANSYYVGLMKSDKEGSDSRKWGDGIQVLMPSFAKGGGTHVNVSGAAVAKYAKNKAAAVKFLEFLASPQAQAIYAEANFEYPVRPGVPVSPMVASFGKLEADKRPVADIATYRKQASELVDKVGFDR